MPKVLVLMYKSSCCTEIGGCWQRIRWGQSRVGHWAAGVLWGVVYLAALCVLVFWIARSAKWCCRPCTLTQLQQPHNKRWMHALYRKYLPIREESSRDTNLSACNMAYKSKMDILLSISVCFCRFWPTKLYMQHVHKSQDTFTCTRQETCWTATSQHLHTYDAWWRQWTACLACQHA